MNIKEALLWATKKLKQKKIKSPILDAEIILGFVLKKEKEFLFAHSEKKLTSPQLIKFKSLIARRLKHEPVAYITNKRYFYDLEFYVDKNVLIPRPETELLVEEAIKILKHNANDANDTRMTRITNLIDIGVGSGCVLISIVKKVSPSTSLRANARAFGVDFSKEALKIAKKNAKKNKVLKKIKFIHSDLLKNIKLKDEKYLITTNLPYLTTNQYRNLPLEIKKYEPKSALIGGKDGLKYYRELLFSLSSHGLSKGSKILLEIDPHQNKTIKKFIKEYFPKAKIEIKKDLAQRDRLVVTNI